MIELAELLLPDATAWRDWLDRHHADSPGVRLVLHRKGGSVTALVYAEALDEALCVGWIDGQVKSRDSESYTQRFTPRRPRSRWSARNVEHVGRLTAQGRMQPAGLAAVTAAQADGRWAAAYAGPASATVPEDFAAAMAAVAGVRAAYDAMTSQNRYAMLYRLASLRTDAARQRRIGEFVAMIGRGETFH